MSSAPLPHLKQSRERGNERFGVTKMQKMDDKLARWFVRQQMAANLAGGVNLPARKAEAKAKKSKKRALSPEKQAEPGAGE